MDTAKVKEMTAEQLIALLQQVPPNTLILLSTPPTEEDVDILSHVSTLTEHLSAFGLEDVSEASGVKACHILDWATEGALVLIGN